MLKAYYKFTGIAYTDSDKILDNLHGSPFGKYVLLDDSEVHDEEYLLYPETANETIKKYWPRGFGMLDFGTNLFSRRKWYAIHDVYTQKLYFDKIKDNTPPLSLRVHYVEFSPSLHTLAHEFSAEDAKRYLDAHSLEFSIDLLKTL